jgi:hypothetical protein
MYKREELERSLQAVQVSLKVVNLLKNEEHNLSPDYSMLYQKLILSLKKQESDLVFALNRGING